MQTVIVGLMEAAFLGVWLLIPIVVVTFRWTVVPRRRKEICDLLQREAAPTEEVRLTAEPEARPIDAKDERAQTAAWHYARLQDPDKVLRKGDETAAVENTFSFYHGKRYYLLPVTLIVVFSAMMLAFSGLWMADRLHLSLPFWDAHASSAKPTSCEETATANTAVKPADTSKQAAVLSASSEKQGSILSFVGSSFVMALLGALVWSLYEILSRSKTGDLTPTELYDVVLRFVTAIPIGYAFSLLVFDRASPWLAFAVSAFPLRDVRQLIRKQTLKKIGETGSPVAAAATPSLIAQTLTGFSDDTIVRLEELNIFTVLDLAYTDPVKLMIKTGVPLELALAWIDKALLAVYATLHIAALERVGMPCALDVCEFYAEHCWDVATGRARPWQHDPAVLELEKELKVPKELLVNHMLKNIYTDPHTKFLVRAWYGPATRESQI